MPSTKIKPAPLERPLSEVAWEIRQDWAKVWFGAEPYLKAMESLGTLEDHYFQDPASDVVIYFISNATQWKGETARRIKAELNAALAYQDGKR